MAWCLPEHQERDSLWSSVLERTLNIPHVSSTECQYTLLAILVELILIITVVVVVVVVIVAVVAVITEHNNH